MKKHFMLATMVVVLSSCVVMAQDQKPAPEPSVSPKGVVKASTLLLEIDPGTPPPGYSEIAAAGETPRWVWVSRSRLIPLPGRQPPPGKPIQAVRFESVVNGESVDVKVTVLRGSQGFEQEDLVGVYQVAIGEQKTITELDRFAIRPFKITVTNTLPPLPPPPSFNNLTKAIEIASVEMENLPRPAYRLTFRNVSEKTIRAVRVDTTTDGRRGELVMYQGEDSRAFLQPGDTTGRRLAVIRSVPTATGNTPGTPAVVIINIRTVVFDDLSFEGEMESACVMESSLMSGRLWLKQVLALLDQELEKPNSDHVVAAKQFKEKLSALSADFDESEQNKASSVAPGCPKPAVVAAKMANGMKVDLVREVERIANTTSTPLNFKSWMEEKRTRYSAWLARL